MKRQGIHRPTIEDLVEISGIETLNPGGFALTRRTAERLALKPGMHLLDVSCGRGTQAVFYVRHGFKGIIKALENEKHFYRAVMDGKFGYGLFKGVKRPG